MSIDLKKRIVTSMALFTLMILMFLYTFVLISSVIIIAVIAWIEFYALISKIFKMSNTKHRILKFLYKSISLMYLFLLVYLIIATQLKNSNLNMVIIYSILVSIMTDIGGLVVGKILKGKKLTKISPNKTIAGSIGSFIFPLFLVPFFILFFENLSFFTLILFTLFISLISQLGDLFISFLKRKAKVKDTSDLLPGHGGFLDRIDGIIFTIPVTFLIFFKF